MAALLVTETTGKQSLLADCLRKAGLTSYEVVSCSGHYCGLPKSSVGVDSKTFGITWKVRNMQAFDRMKKAVAAAESVYAATDSSPEGEAIAQQISITCDYAKKPFHRLRLSSLDPDSLRAALSSPTSLDTQLVQGYLAREVASRVVQFTLSPSLSSLGEDLALHRSALPLLSELARVERRIRKFVSTSGYQVRALLSDGSVAESAVLEKSVAEEYARRALAAVPAFSRAIEHSPPLPPFTLASLVQFAGQKYGIDALTCVKTCESLYEMGLITYPYTDSTRLAPSFVTALHAHISEKMSGLPSGIVSPTPLCLSTDSTPEECIRPVQFHLFPSQLKLGGDMRTLYSAIWFRTAGTQGLPAKIENQKVLFTIDDQEVFSASGLSLTSVGWHQLSGRLFEPTIRPIDADAVVVEASVHLSHAHPPKRHSFGSLVAWLNSHSITKPWAYMSALQFLTHNSYIDTLGGSLIRISPKGETVLTFVKRHAEDLLDPATASSLEADLLAVEQGSFSFNEFCRHQFDWASHLNSVMQNCVLRPSFAAPDGKKLEVRIEKDSGRPYVKTDDDTWRSYVFFNEKGKICQLPESTQS